MLANFVKETISAGGVGALTLSGKVTSFIDFNSAVGVNKYFNYTIEDGNDREVGIGHITTSTNFVRDTVLETLVSGVLDRTSPSAINATTAAEVMIVATSQRMSPNHYPGAFVGDGLAGMGPQQGKSTDTQGNMITGYLFMMPFRWYSSQQIDEVAISVAAGLAGQTAHMAIYEIDADGFPGNRLISFTETTALPLDTAGVKTQAADTAIDLPAGDYYMGFTCSSTTPTFKRPQYSGPFTFLGVKSSNGLQVNILNRVFTFAECPADESASSWTLDTGNNWATFWVK